MAKLLVLDIGGTYIKYGATDERGALLPESVRQTPSHADEEAGAFLDALRRIIRDS